MLRRLLPWPALTILALASACSDAPGPGQPLVYADDPIEAVAVIRHVPFEANDALAIVRVADLIATATGYAVADAGGQVLLLGEDLELEHRYGREGSGPAELRLPLDLEPLAGGGVAIYDSGNQRIALIDAGGRPVATVPPVAAAPTDFAALPDGSLIVGRITAEHALAVYAPPDRGPFGRLPPDVGTVPQDREAAALQSLGALLVAGSDGMVHHYDSRERRLYSYGADGSLVALRRFPDRTLELLEASREAAARAFGESRVVGFSSVLGLSRAGPHPIIVAPALPEVPGIGLVLDRSAPRATPVVAGPGLAPDGLEGVAMFALRGQVLTVAKADGLHQYRIRYPAHLAALARLSIPTSTPPDPGAAPADRTGVP